MCSLAAATAAAAVVVSSSGISQSFWLTKKVSLSPDMRQTSNQMYVSGWLHAILDSHIISLYCQLWGRRVVGARTCGYYSLTDSTSVCTWLHHLIWFLYIFLHYPLRLQTQLYSHLWACSHTIWPSCTDTSSSVATFTLFFCCLQKHAVMQNLQNSENA